ncbi:helix-turn-helix domain-containing protein [Streptomyces sp. NPDC090109]|uniref:helix-turn-helix domain-containing protein n=1 Tax=unclassified Streptomyces TaxID=2593676 RepID=UPI00136C1287|nr:helix-turn-helix domain-containing protein [Streptomyces sp. SID5770]MZE56479.1 helix-turn-helix domain-containing protein [Streptomyces sp. SID5770]
MVRPNSVPPPDWVLTRRVEFGTRVRDERMHANLTQERLGLLADLSRSTIQAIEAGRAAPTVDTVLLLADAIGIPPARFFE